MTNPTINTFQVQSISAGINPIVRTNRIIKQMIVGGLISVTILGVGYILLLNRLSTSGFKLQTARYKQTELRITMEEMDINIANEGTLYAFRTNRTVQSMPSAKPKFVAITPSSSVALAD